MKINISDLTWDRFIYPRCNKSQKTITAYIEALSIGAKFPPIKIQKVFNYTDENGNKSIQAIIILDGIHRWSAFKENGIKEIAARKQSTTTGIPKKGHGPSQKNRILFFFDPPYYTKKAKEYEEKANEKRILGTVGRTLLIAKKC